MNVCAAAAFSCVCVCRFHHVNEQGDFYPRGDENVALSGRMWWWEGGGLVMVVRVGGGYMCSSRHTVPRGAELYLAATKISDF